MRKTLLSKQEVAMEWSETKRNKRSPTLFLQALKSRGNFCYTVEKQ